MSEEVRFVHAADTHLGAPFAGVDAKDSRVKEALVRATRDAFARVVDTCIAREADFLVLAGDVMDTGERDLAAHFAFQAGMRRLAAEGIIALVARGNHDPADGWSAGLEIPSTVHFFADDRVERVPIERDGKLVAAVYGRSFATRAVYEDLAAGFAREAGDPLAVAVLHTNVGGSPEHEPYAPSRLETLRAARMDYWALGHIHKPETLSEDPTVLYSGSTQGLNPGDTGPRGCVVVTLSGGGVQTERVDTAAVLWASETVSMGEASGMDAVRNALRQTCDRARDEAGGRPSVLRLEMKGRTAAHEEISQGRCLTDLLEDLRDEQMMESPWVWVDRIRDNTRPMLDLDEVRSGSDLAADIVRVADDLLGDPAVAAASVEEMLEPLRRAFGDVWDERLSASEIVEVARDLCLDGFGVKDETCS